MPVLIRFNALVGTVTDEYLIQEGEQLYPVPEGFDLDSWEFVEGALRKKPVRLTRLQFMECFTIPELGGIYAAAPGNPAISIFLDKVKVAEWVEPQAPQVVQGLAYLVEIGLLSPARQAAILAGVLQ